MYIWFHVATEDYTMSKCFSINVEASTKKNTNFELFLTLPTFELYIHSYIYIYIFIFSWICTPYGE